MHLGFSDRLWCFYFLFLYKYRDKGGTSKSIVCCALAAVEEPHNETNKTNKTKSDENLESTPKPTNVTTDSRSSFVFSATDDGNSTMSKIEGGKCGRKFHRRHCDG